MKKTRLFDFSVLAILAVLIVFPFLTVISFNLFYYENSIFFGIFLIFVVIGFFYILYYFVWKAPYLDQEGAHCRNLFIPKNQLDLISEYDIRFKEPVYLLRDKNTDYRDLDDKALAQKQIRVQATMANTRKLTEYSGNVMSPAQKPKRGRRG